MNWPAIYDEGWQAGAFLTRPLCPYRLCSRSAQAWLAGCDDALRAYARHEARPPLTAHHKPEV